MTTDQLRNVILEAVDCLRQRKCRPDRESIAVYVMRKLGSSMNEIFSEIENVVDQGSLLKVEYKGSTSYRSPKSFDVKNSPLLTKHSKILNSSKTTRYVISGINELLSTFPNYIKDGVPYDELKKKLIEFDKERFVESGIKVIFEREEGAGNIYVAHSEDPIDPIRIFPKDIQVPEGMKLISFCEEANPTPERKKRKRTKKEEATETNDEKQETEESSTNGSPDSKRLVYAVKSDPHKISENGSSDKAAKTKAEQISSIGFKLIAEKAATARKVNSVKSKAKGKNGSSVPDSTSNNTSEHDIKVKSECDRKPCLTLLIHETDKVDSSKRKEIVNGVEKTPSTSSPKSKGKLPAKRKLVTTESPVGGNSIASVKGKKQKLSTPVKIENEPDDLQLLRVNHEPPRFTYAFKRRSYSSNCSSSSQSTIATEEVTLPDLLESSDSIANGERVEECVYCRKEKNSIGDSEDFLSCGSCNAKIHPTCIDYSEEQAKRLRTNSKSSEPHLQWQCFSCKRCGVCQQALMSSKSCTEVPKKNGDKSKILKKKEGRYILCDRCDKAERTVKKQVSKGKKTGRQSVVQNDETNSVLEVKEEPVSDSSAEDSSTSTASCSTPKKTEIPDISSWTPTQVQKFFSEKGLQDEAASLREQEIDGMSLLLLRRADIIFGLNLRLGPALKIYRLVSQLQQNSTALKKKIGENSGSKRSDVSR
ncbi:Atherin [Orchesella cincta]|uniref:Atherin n=1 Tax=Orchesella cincta TaxID=48709 RepID=A0A1D2N6G5_ORCCI|nr:Atherin [Orchesella cincta]